MKQRVIKNILLVCVIANLMSSSLHAAVGDWFARQKQRSSEYVLRKINEAEQKTKELLASLRANASCLVRGDCPVEKMKRLRVLAGTISAAVLVVAAAAIGSRYMQEDELVISQPKGPMRTVSRVAIARKYGIEIGAEEERESSPSQFLFAVETGGDSGFEQAKKYADVVENAVLSAGMELAKIRNHMNINFYLSKLHDANTLLIEKANAGVLDKVREVYCDIRRRPSQWAVKESIRKAQERMRQYAEGQTARKLFTQIVDFLSNPVCGAPASE